MILAVTDKLRSKSRYIKEAEAMRRAGSEHGFLWVPATFSTDPPHSFPLVDQGHQERKLQLGPPHPLAYLNHLLYF